MAGEAEREFGACFETDEAHFCATFSVGFFRRWQRTEHALALPVDELAFETKAAKAACVTGAEFPAGGGAPLRPYFGIVDEVSGGAPPEFCPGRRFAHAVTLEEARQFEFVRSGTATVDVVLPSANDGLPVSADTGCRR